MEEKNGKKGSVDRRGFLTRTAAAATISASALHGSGDAFAASSRKPEYKPNIVLLIADDLGDGDLGCYGHPTIRTENLDRLAGEGVRFTSAFVTTSSCSPSRTSMLTGRYPHATGAEDLHVPLPAGQVIFPAILAEHGYHTMYTGKLHLGPEGEKQFHQFDVGPIDRDSSRWKSFLAGRPKDRPFFLGIGFTDPHRPYNPGAISDPTDPSQVIVPPYLADTPETREDLALYYDYTVRMDRNTGELLAELDREGLADNTIVIFFSDNGMPFPRAKTSCYDSGIRTPLIVRWPGRIPAGIVSDSLASTVDLAPTILGILGIDIPTRMQGVDIKEMFFDPNREVRDYIHAERNWHNIDDHQRAVRDRRYKYIRNYYPRKMMPLASDLISSASYDSLLRLRDANMLTREQLRLFMVPRPGEELYDTEKDPYELTCLAGDPNYRYVLERMRTECDRWIATTEDVSPEKRMKDNLDIFTKKKFGKLDGPPEPDR